MVDNDKFWADLEDEPCDACGIKPSKHAGHGSFTCQACYDARWCLKCGYAQQLNHVCPSLEEQAKRKKDNDLLMALIHNDHDAVYAIVAERDEEIVRLTRERDEERMTVLDLRCRLHEARAELARFKEETKAENERRSKYFNWHSYE